MTANNNSDRTMPAELMAPENARSVPTVSPEAALARWSDMESRIGALAKMQERVRALIDQRVDAWTCFDIVDGVACRNINYAKTVFRLVGGTFEWLKDERGWPLVIRHDYKDSEGDYYVYEAYGRYTLPTGEAVEASGMFSSRDKFFGRKDGAFKATSEVDERYVRQAAQTECFKKAVFTAMGYGDLTKEEADRMRLNVNKERGYQHAKGSKGGSTDAAPDTSKRSEIEKLCRQLLNAGFEDDNGKRADTAEEVLTMITANPEKGWSGWRTFRAIKDTQLDRILAKCRELAAEWGEGGAAEDGDAASGKDVPLPFGDDNE